MTSDVNSETSKVLLNDKFNVFQEPEYDLAINKMQFHQNKERLERQHTLKQ